jgi:hypothetical protein
MRDKAFHPSQKELGQKILHQLLGRYTGLLELIKSSIMT